MVRYGAVPRTHVAHNFTGGVIYPIIFHRLVSRIGFGWTTRVIGFIILATLAVPLAVIKVRVVPASKRKLVDWTAFTEPAYVLFILGGMITFLGIYVPFFYIQYYATSTGITDSNLGFYLLPILNSASVGGRILPNVRYTFSLLSVTMRSSLVIKQDSLHFGTSYHFHYPEQGSLYPQVKSGTQNYFANMPEIIFCIPRYLRIKSLTVRCM